MDFEQRLLDAMEELFDLSRGTLWVVNDRLWDKVITNFIKKRKGHPGISLGKRYLYTVHDSIGMLIGTSKKYKGNSLVVNNIFGEDSNCKKTTFFEIRPYQLPIKGFVGGEPMIEKNSNKPKLKSNELDNLNNYLRSKGLDI